MFLILIIKQLRSKIITYLFNSEVHVYLTYITPVIPKEISIAHEILHTQIHFTFRSQF